MTRDDFIKKCLEKHGNKYDYSKAEYKNADDKVCIICPEHGEFWQRPINHYKRGQGCPHCSRSIMEETVADFLQEQRIIRVM